MAPSDKPGSVKLPVAPDFDQILNRVSLAVSKSHRLFSQAHRADSASTSSTPAPTNKLGPFSSHGSGTEANPAQPHSSAARYTYKTAAQRAVEDADFEATRNLPPNAGLGFVAPGAGGRAEAARRQREEQFALRRKLGLKGSTGTSMAVKRGREEESESEEETGRSGLGRVKKIKAQITRGGDTGLDGRKERGKTRNPLEAAHAVPDAEQASREDQGLGPDNGATSIVQHTKTRAVSSGLPTTSEQVDAGGGVGLAKTKRKKKKNKKASAAK
ncbi:hypothetical protein GQ53DRAFT_816761 [Thozetella sp. PMI_491]|nr:hypothetical protein GQ53DRAFT_816761 [Thozetella sp. PMI_491]